MNKSINPSLPTTSSNHKKRSSKYNEELGFEKYNDYKNKLKFDKLISELKKLKSNSSI
jgi:hypothetical protein